jgi:hypothetical protein
VSAMEELRATLEELIAGAGHAWELRGSKLHVSLGGELAYGESTGWEPGAEARERVIELLREGDHFRFTAQVLGAKRGGRKLAERRRLALQAWERNARTELVTYHLDDRDRLLATIRHPAAQLDPEELELYITTLAAGAERFGQVLEGEGTRQVIERSGY